MKAIKYLLVLILMLTLTIPAMAGNGPGGPGGGGGGGGNGGGKKQDIPDTGTLYGDLYVILRDENGVPVLDGNDCIQPISAVDGGILEIYDSTDTTVLFTTEAIAGEPFALAYYTDATIELDVECELTEEMADWVETVDFGRLNLGRAPVSVIAHAFDEAVNKMNAATDMELDPAGRLLVYIPDAEDPDTYVWKTIDAPAENLALYIEMMTDGDWITEDTTPIVNGGLPTDIGSPEGDGPSAEDRPVLGGSAINFLAGLGFVNLGTNYDTLDQNGVDMNDVRAEDSLNDQELLLAASLLAAAADKTGSITLDKVIYINFIYGVNQAGGLVGAEGRTYFDFSVIDPDGEGEQLPRPFEYGRDVYESRGSEDCNDGWVWVLQPTDDENIFVTQCVEILKYENSDIDPGEEVVHDPTINAVRFWDMVETYDLATDAEGNPITGYDFVDNVRAFAQAADDALQVIEYIHNYKIPEVLYPED